LCEKAVFHRISVNGTDIGVPQNVRICFDFPDAVWVSASGAFRIISDTLVSVAVLCFFVLTRLLCNGWTDFHQIFTNSRLCGVIRQWWYRVKIGPPPKKKMFYALNVHFERKFGLQRLGTAAAWKRGGILGKLKHNI